ncbi:hypothetical protein FACS189418_0050 [Clostridia bacterium]|nr:hypothetical protein FACS189418_0050 [Clostridia bacterium]
MIESLSKRQVRIEPYLLDDMLEYFTRFKYFPNLRKLSIDVIKKIIFAYQYLDGEPGERCATSYENMDEEEKEKLDRNFYTFIQKTEYPFSPQNPAIEKESQSLKELIRIFWKLYVRDIFVVVREKAPADTFYLTMKLYEVLRVKMVVKAGELSILFKSSQEQTYKILSEKTEHYLYIGTQSMSEDGLIHNFKILDIVIRERYLQGKIFPLINPF